MSAVDLQPLPPTPLGVALPRLESFVSPLTGVVRRLTEIAFAPDEMRLVSIGCELADGVPAIGAPLEAFTGSCHTSRAAATAAAIGEALERYAGSYVPGERLVLATAEELGPDAVAPERFALFSEAQYRAEGFPFRPFRADAVVSWVDGFAIPSGEHAWLPAQLVYMPWRRRAPAEAPIGHATSSGLACGPTLEEAVLAGLLEVVERDAFMIAWHGRLSLPLLDWSSDDTLSRLDRRYFVPAGLRYAAVDLSVFLDVPTVLGVVHGPPGQLGALGVGAGSAPTVEEAWRKALSEAFSVQRWVRDRAFEEPGLLDRAAHEMRSFDDHTLFYASAARAEHAAFLDSSGTRRDIGETPPLEGGNVLEQIEAVARRLDACGASAYAVDVTTSDVRAAGLSVVHVLAPELCALDVVEGARFLGGERLYRAAYEAGLVSRPLEAADLNPCPHPFP